jgi:hypothetical protein
VSTQRFAPYLLSHGARFSRGKLHKAADADINAQRTFALTICGRTLYGEPITKRRFDDPKFVPPLCRRCFPRNPND